MAPCAKAALPLLAVLIAAACSAQRAPGNSLPRGSAPEPLVRAGDTATAGARRAAGAAEVLGPGGFSYRDLQQRAARVQVQHVANSLIEARARGMTPTEQGAAVGSRFAQYKERQLWHYNGRRLMGWALAKVASDSVAVETGPAMFMIRSRYAPLEEQLRFYGANMSHYIDWLAAMHSEIGAVEGYAMTAELENGWLVETYRDLPRYQGLTAAPTLRPAHLRTEEMRRHVGRFVGGSTHPDYDAAWALRVWEEEGRLWLDWYPEGGRAGRGGHLVPIGDGRFRPGWIPYDGPPLVDEHQVVRFEGADTDRSDTVFFDVEIGGEIVRYEFLRR